MIRPGTRFGHQVVIGPARARKRGATVRVRCDCGDERDVLERHLLVDGVKACRPCALAGAARRVRSELSVKLRTGKTVAQVAQESGLELDTVYGRYRRGWPHERLGDPLRITRRPAP